MRRSLFVSILHNIQQVNEYFIQTRDATGAPRLSGIQKMTAALRILQYGVPADAVDEYIRIGENVARLLQEGEQRGFPGMLGSLDCMHWRWDKCPSAQAGAYTGHYHKPTVVLEAVDSYDLWIWHAFFGMPGSLNDITVLDRSPLFAELTRGRAPAANYTINNHAYTMGIILLMVSTSLGNDCENNISTSRRKETTICEDAGGMSERLSKGHLECSKHDLILSACQLEVGVMRICTTS
ncbi:uncharacterized protein LOC114268226 [Camellia sinensis]|uniref:uncharacterized protein LOC114268226 n=1 Tax=Camellia sinensis TaxID=4442 RepID=UPI001035C96A|nr:uncharacterized protein LOC114268226 [Camellia sinensis]